MKVLIFTILVIGIGLVLGSRVYAGYQLPNELQYPGYAEPVYPPDGPYACWVQGLDSQLWYPCGQAPPPCLNQMERAMRAVEPFLKSNQSMSEDVASQWERSKRYCWSQTPDKVDPDVPHKH